MRCARLGGPRTPSTIAVANLDCAFDKNALFYCGSLILNSQQNIIESVGRPVIAVIPALVEAVPMVAGHPNGVPFLQIYLVFPAFGLVAHDGFLLVVVLTPEVPDVVQRLEVGRTVDEPLLLNLISDPADLSGLVTNSVLLC